MEAAVTEAEVKWPERREERVCEARPAGVEDGADWELKNKELKKHPKKNKTRYVELRFSYEVCSEF